MNCGLMDSSVRRDRLVLADHDAWATRFSSGRVPQFARAEVQRIGRALVKGLVRTAGVVETKVLVQGLVDLHRCLVSMQIGE